MGVLRFNFRSEAVGKYLDVTVVLPTDALSYRSEEEQRAADLRGNAPVKPQYRPGMKFQTIYLIHGGGDDDSLAYRYTNAELYAQQNHVILVTPDLSNSFGADTEYGVGYLTFLTKELPRMIQSLFPSSPAREDNFIVGYAMGGNVALGAAMICPENYAACVDMSGGIGYTPRPDVIMDELNGDHFKNKFPLYCTTFGPAERFSGSRHDLRAHIRRHQAAGTKLPELTIICGSKEFVRDRIEGDVQALRDLGVNLRYICAEGYDHDFALWDHYLRILLDEQLPLRRAPMYAE